MKRSTKLLSAIAAAAFLVATPVLAGASPAAPAPASGNGYDILFVRHADTTYPFPEQEITAKGIQQAAALVQLLHDAPITSVDTSMKVRAFQTGDGVATDHNLTLLADKDLNEIEFDLTGVPLSQTNARLAVILKAWMTGQQLDNHFCQPGHDCVGDNPACATSNFCQGENYYEVKARWDRWWAQYVRDHRNGKGTGVVVAHGALYAVMLPTICSNEVTADFSLHNLLANTGMVKAHLNPNGTLVCTEWNGVPVPSAP